MRHFMHQYGLVISKPTKQSEIACNFQRQESHWKKNFPTKQGLEFSLALEKDLSFKFVM